MDSIKVVLISIDKVIKEAFTKQLNDILGDRILIKSYLLHEENIDFSDCDLVVCSSKAIYDDVLSIVTPNIKVIAARRAINLANLTVGSQKQIVRIRGFLSDRIM